MTKKLNDIESKLYESLIPEVREILDIINSNDQTYLVILPDPDHVDAPLEELASLVARTSNAYGRIARFAGMAKAEAKLAKGRFDRKYKRSKVGNNEAERERVAIEACEEEHVAMTVAEAISDMADQVEHAARVASESARKMYDKASAMNYAQRREDHGYYQDKDFKPY